MADQGSGRHAHVSHRLSQVRWFDLARRVASVLPRPMLRGLATAIGLTYGWLARRKRGIVRTNLCLIVPAPVADRTAKRVYGHFARTLSDYFYLGNRSRAEALALIEERSGYEHLQAAQALGKGVLLLTAHLGFFELGGLLMAELGFPTVALSLPEVNPELTQWRQRYRAHWGVETIEVGTDEFAFASVRQRLLEGRFVAALIDRPSGAHNFPVPMPYGTMWCSGSILLLAILTRCPIVTVAVVNKPNGRYRVEAHAPIQLEETRLSTDALERSTRRVMANLLPSIQAHPDQWFQFAPLTPAQ